ncbi:MAG: hypothetical protein ABI442_14640 [Gemmatimonadaceae bacterium]
MATKAALARQRRFPFRPATHKFALAIDPFPLPQVVPMELTFRDPDSYLQRSRGFHWVQELPFNR